MNMKTINDSLNSDDIMNLVELAISIFVNKITKVKNDRYKSWEYCYRNFIEARQNSSPNYDILSLHLAFYLASWGMYRGSSFLLHKDYKIHRPVVEMLLNQDYANLAGIDWVKNKQCDDELHLLGELQNNINDYYASVRKDVVIDLKNNEYVSEILVTKILMGTLGCAPAYDRYFKLGIKFLNVSTGNFNRNSIEKLISFYTLYSDRFEQIRNKLHVDDSGMKYPQMKLIDMGFWLIGYAVDVCLNRNHVKNPNKNPNKNRNQILSELTLFSLEEQLHKI